MDYPELVWKQVDPRPGEWIAFSYVYPNSRYLIRVTTDGKFCADTQMFPGGGKTEYDEFIGAKWHCSEFEDDLRAESGEGRMDAVEREVKKIKSDLAGIHDRVLEVHELVKRLVERI